MPNFTAPAPFESSIQGSPAGVIIADFAKSPTTGGLSFSLCPIYVELIASPGLPAAPFLSDLLSALSPQPLPFLLLSLPIFI